MHVPAHLLTRKTGGLRRGLGLGGEIEPGASRLAGGVLADFSLRREFAKACEPRFKRPLAQAQVDDQIGLIQPASRFAAPDSAVASAI
jgi:hypothetical protein